MAAELARLGYGYNSYLQLRGLADGGAFKFTNQADYERLAAAVRRQSNTFLLIKATKPMSVFVSSCRFISMSRSSSYLSSTSSEYLFNFNKEKSMSTCATARLTACWLSSAERGPSWQASGRGSCASTTR